jgi:ABC-type transport system involved in cytochrome bd biosynthesis fused ATPase/permease subunit
VALIFAAAGIALAVVGIIRGAVPANPLSIFLALLISGGSWGVVSWAVTTAIVDVERDVAEDAREE